MKTFFFIAFLSLFTACSNRICRYQINEVAVNPFTPPIDLNQTILVNLPQRVSQKDYRTMLEILPAALRSYGFREVWNSDYHDIELRSVGISDFSTDRNKVSLYEDLGVTYLLDIEILERNPYRYGKLSQLMEYNIKQNQDRFNGGFQQVRSFHYVTLRYTLYRTDQLDTVAELEVRANHKDDNTLNPKVFERDLKVLFFSIYEAHPY
jgi:hypothetical protein